MKTIICKFRVVILSVLVSLSGHSVAQTEASYITIKGTLKDSKTRRDLPFASISVVGSHVGTVSNSDGDFTLKILQSLNAQNILFTHLGYQNREVSIESLQANSHNVITLEPCPINLSEVTVRPLDAAQIVEEALRKVPFNYSSTPNMLLGFYRETIRQRRDFVSISEAVVDIYKAPYRTGSESDRVRIFKGRKSANVKPSDTLAVKLQGGPSVSLLLDIAKHQEIFTWGDGLAQYNFTLENVVTIDNTLCYVISFAQKKHITEPLYYGKLFIDTKNLGIVMAQFSLNLDDRERASELFVRRKPAGVRFIPTSTFYMVTYRQHNGLYYLSYVRNEVTFKCTWPRRIFSSTYTINAELAITDRTTENITRFPLRESFKRTDVFADEVAAFNDENFWGEFNYIDPEESIEEAIRRYGRRLRRQ